MRETQREKGKEVTFKRKSDASTSSSSSSSSRRSRSKFRSKKLKSFEGKKKLYFFIFRNGSNL